MSRHQSPYAAAIRPELVRRAVVIQVIVADRVVAEIDPRPIAEAQQRGQQMATEPVPEEPEDVTPEAVPEEGTEQVDEVDEGAGKGGAR